MTAALAAAAATAAGTWLLLRDGGARRVLAPVPGRWRLPDLVAHPRAPLVAAAGGAGAVAVLRGPAVAAAVALVAWALALELRAGRAERTRRASRRAWAAALRGLSVALAAGGALPESLERGGAAAAAVADGDAARALPAAAAVARVGGDPIADLARRTRDGPGERLVAALSLAATAGVAPAQLADGLAAGVTAEERAGHAADVALAGAAATARLLAALPLAGIGLAAAFGASAPAFLLGTPLGRGCLLAAAVLEVAGLRWSARIVAAARR